LGVLAHELAHYARQQPEHDHDGILRPGFRGQDLAAAAIQPFSLRD
jgi:hypothetical protein